MPALTASWRAFHRPIHNPFNRHNHFGRRDSLAIVPCSEPARKHPFLDVNPSRIASMSGCVNKAVLKNWGSVKRTMSLTFVAIA